MYWNDYIPFIALYPIFIIVLICVWRTFIELEHLQKRCLIKKTHYAFTHAMSTAPAGKIAAFVASRRRCQTVSRFCLAIDYEVESREIERRLRSWRASHPWGPTNNKEMAELEWLIYELAGTITARSADLDQPYSMDRVDEILSDIDDWRS